MKIDLFGILQVLCLRNRRAKLILLFCATISENTLQRKPERHASQMLLFSLRMVEKLQDVSRISHWNVPVAEQL